MLRINSLLIAAILSLLSAGGFSSADKPDWKLATEKKGIKAYTREVEGSQFLEAKLITEFDANIETVLAEVITDFNSCAKWVKLCKNSKVLKKVSDTEVYAYSVLDFPFFMSDRDIVNHFVITKDPKTKVVTISANSAPDMYPGQDGKVRMQSTVTYTVKPLSENKVEFVWQVHSDPGGGISPGMVNSQLPSQTIDDLLSLRELIEQRKKRNL